MAGFLLLPVRVADSFSKHSCSQTLGDWIRAELWDKGPFTNYVIHGSKSGLKKITLFEQNLNLIAAFSNP